MEFEFDKLKSERNKEKHGINFAEGQLVWEDIDRIEIPARTQDEPRYLVIGKNWKQVLIGYYHIQARKDTDYIGSQVAERGDRNI